MKYQGHKGKTILQILKARRGKNMKAVRGMVWIFSAVALQACAQAAIGVP